MSELSDEDLMRRYVEGGDRDAYATLFRRYAARITGTFRRAGLSEPIAQDLLQTTFLHVHRARNDFRPDGRFRPWLFAIALNVRREHFRRRMRKPETPLDLDTHAEPSVAPDASTAQERLLRRALLELPEAQREVIQLHWFQDIPFTEIAEIVGASHAAVKVRAHRGYARLRELLGDP